MAGRCAELGFRWKSGWKSKVDFVGRVVVVVVVLNGLVSRSSSLSKEIPSPLSLDIVLNGLSIVSVKWSCLCAEFS